MVQYYEATEGVVQDTKGVAQYPEGVVQMLEAPEVPRCPDPKNLQLRQRYHSDMKINPT